MSVFKCKMCGGNLDVTEDMTICKCSYCETNQTIPKLDSERKVNLYDRANHFRRNNDYDKAIGIYEQILNEDNTDSEAYWSLVLCRYGIEYVEDPQTHKRIPTVNRTQFTSIYMDEDYKSALQYSDAYQKPIYETEAKAIDDIQKGILEISLKEEPFDVFICYKETDSSGKRTQDSVLATDLYHQLTAEGFKVFFSRITLEDKIGIDYEPYIFSALNSAKVMVVLGTKQEYFNSVWVKNEWSRYLSLVKNSGGKKILIPAFRDMDPYDLPDEFSHLQAQDMSKLGFMQDLIRGIKKIHSVNVPITTEKETVVVSANTANVAPLLERASIFLEDGKWKDADNYCEKVLDIEPKNAIAYLGKLMAELRVRNFQQLANYHKAFDYSDNYQKVFRFGDDKIKEKLSRYISRIRERDELARRTKIYDEAERTMDHEKPSEETYRTAANLFLSIGGFKNSDEMAKYCLDKAEKCRVAEEERKRLDRLEEEAAQKQAEIVADIVIAAITKKQSSLDKHEESPFQTREEDVQKVRLTEYSYERAIQVLLTDSRVLKIVNDRGIDLISSYGNFRTIKFGRYPNMSENDISDIEWLVLKNDGDKLLLVSKYALDYRKYHYKNIRVSWQNCTLREWLNYNFLKSAFNKIERKKILITKVHTVGSYETFDKVFILSDEEVDKYIISSGKHKWDITYYCFKLGADEAPHAGNYWWSRDLYMGNGGSDKAKCFYHDNGETKQSELSVGSPALVRPALWISLEPR